MLFSSLFFIYLFLPAVLAAYYLTPKRYRNAALCLCSLFFYAWGEPVLVLLMLGSIAANHGFGRMVAGTNPRRRLWLVLSVVFNLTVLGFFKYAGLIVRTLNLLPGAAFPVPEIALPLGVSFYTFQAMSYGIDVYRGGVRPARNLLDTALFVSLFPQLVAGPIVRFASIEKELRQRTVTIGDFGRGILLFVLGLSKKVLLANSLASVCDAVFDNRPYRMSFLTAVIAVAAYALQIYFDFSGYSDMARGLCRLFGFHLPVNFDYPYVSRSVSEFFRRWHISLGVWFRDYVYVPMGGSRVGRGRLALNLAAVWLLTGIWHGAAYNFVAWGLFLGGFIILEKLWLNRWLAKLPNALCRGYTLAVILCGWVLFRADGLDGAAAFVRASLSGGLADATAWYLLRENAVPLLPGVLAALPLGRRLYCRVTARFPALTGHTGYALLEGGGLAALLLLCTVFLANGTYNPFLYFRF
jgi:alginate O-acetyltransferase complex protein AlgI